MHNNFSYNNYLVKKKILKLAGATLHIYDLNQNVVFYVKMKAFKLKEDIRIYSSEGMDLELLSIQARNAIDFSGTYDVIDSTNGEKVGVLRRKGLKSILKDEWIVMNADDQEIGLIKEDGTLLALVRRFLTNLIPQSYDVEINGVNVCRYKQNFNPFVTKIAIDFLNDDFAQFDKRLGIAAAILLCTIEGKQN